MKLMESKVKDFLETLSGNSPAPGGGSVSAFAAALSAALCAMVARLTLGKEKHRGVWKEMERLRDNADSFSLRLTTLAEEDQAAYERVIAAFRIPKERQSVRRDALESAFKEAAAVPMETLRASADLMELVKTALDRGNPNCITDAGVAAQLVRAAAKGAAYNVLINLHGVPDREFTAQLASEVSELIENIEASITTIEERIRKHFEESFQ